MFYMREWNVVHNKYVIDRKKADTLTVLSAFMLYKTCSSLLFAKRRLLLCILTVCTTGLELGSQFLALALYIEALHGYQKTTDPTESIAQVFSYGTSQPYSSTRMLTCPLHVNTRNRTYLAWNFAACDTMVFWSEFPVKTYKANKSIRRKSLLLSILFMIV